LNITFCRVGQRRRIEVAIVVLDKVRDLSVH
jgi:hypothetical protein